ncbi:hypothetical protein BpHYR1_022173 [Brachionus plicatilis]|uniref:Uncharacterized protein n=1 Tax=Brachionus plicatilis TaxID=10195 RepID=A0A3M7QFA3_BRAPC|nr:hypothetical protein BpHYR1_022173 [Brachionus plicatilis]
MQISFFKNLHSREHIRTNKLIRFSCIPEIINASSESLLNKIIVRLKSFVKKARQIIRILSYFDKT